MLTESCNIIKMTQRLTIYYDGSCGICRQEMAKLQAKDTRQCLDLVDASKPDFNAKAQGLDQNKLRQVLHLKDAQGRLYLGVDAFEILWRMTGHPVLAFFCRMPVSKQVAQIIYRIFAKYRYVFSHLKPHCDQKNCSWERV